METISKYRITRLNIPVDGYSYNLQVYRSVDGGQNFAYCGEGGYFNTEVKKNELLAKYGLTAGDNMESPIPWKFPWEYTDEELAALPEPDYSDKTKYPHGRVVDGRFEPYHDVTVYEDGYEDWYPVGD